MGQYNDITGQRFGRWTVLSYADTKKNQYKSQPARWNVRCDCGSERIILGYTLRNGNSKSCGCLQKEIATTRGQLITKELHPNWKGGLRLTKQGYVQISIGLIRDMYPDAVIKGRRAYEHIAAMSHQLKRQLHPNETVHHKDGKRNNNNITNLELRVGNHGPGQSIDDIINWATTMLSRYAPELLASK